MLNESKKEHYEKAAIKRLIYYGHRMVQDTDWIKHLDYRWKPEALREAIKTFPGLKLQKASEQRRFKISYDVNPQIYQQAKTNKNMLIW